MEDATSRACPWCGAAAGTPCVTADGEVARQLHKFRVQPPPPQVVVAATTTEEPTAPARRSLIRSGLGCIGWLIVWFAGLAIIGFTLSLLGVGGDDDDPNDIYPDVCYDRSGPYAC